MAVIAISRRAPDAWVMKRRTLATLIELTQPYLDNPSDRYELEVSLASEGLHFHLMSRVQAKRLALAVGKAARDLRIMREQSQAPDDQSFIPTLREIQERLTNFAKT